MPFLDALFRRTRKKAPVESGKDDASLSGSNKPTRGDLSRRISSKLGWPRGFRKPDDKSSNGNSAKSIPYSNEHSPDMVSGMCWVSQSTSPSTPVSRCPSNLETRVPLPLPPNFSRVKQPIVQSFLPLSPVGTKHRSVHRDAEGTSGYLTDSASSDCSSESGIGHEVVPPYRRQSEAEALRNQRSVIYEESQPSPGHFPIHSPTTVDVTQPGSPALPAPSRRVEFRNNQVEGGDLHIHIHVNGVQNSASNSTFSSPVLSPRALGPQEPTWLWNPATNHVQQTSSTTSGHNSGHNSISSDFPLQHRRPSSDLSPRAQSRSMSPRHPLSTCTGFDSLSWADVHPLPRPPTSGTATASPSTPLSPRSSGVPPRSTASKIEAGVSIGKWQKGRLLGSGSFGKVYKGIHSETGEFCAIKEVEFIRDDPKSKESAKQLAQEIMLLSSLRHPNIVHYKGSETVGGSLYIYLELVSGGSIYKLHQEFRKFEEPVIRRYTRQILQGLQFLHGTNTVHRDIKGANILVDQDGTVKLADFGMAKHIKEQGVPLSFKGSPYWMAPEVIMQRNTGYEFAVDIWSLGCTVVEMVTGKPPWSEYEGVAAMFKVTRAETPPIPENLSDEGQSFIRLCLQRNPAYRPSAAALLNHPFVQIPGDGPDLGTYSISIPKLLSPNQGERSMLRENDRMARASQRQAGPQIPIPNASASRNHLYPSMSAPVSPRSSHQVFGGLLPSRLAGVLPGFSTPPTGAPAVPVPGCMLYNDSRSNSSMAQRKAGLRPDVRHNIPASLHVTVNGPDSQWDIVSDNRQVSQNYPPLHNGIYASRNSRPVERGHEFSTMTRKLNGGLQRTDEKTSKGLHKKASHITSKHYGRASTVKLNG